MRHAALLAHGFGRTLGPGHRVHRHTHLAENDSDIAFTREQFKAPRPTTPKPWAGWTRMSGTPAA